MPQALPVIGGILGVVNAVQGIQSQQASQRALSQASGVTEEQNRELANLRAILSDPNHPMRQILRAQAEANIARQVSTGTGDLMARLAASGFRGQSLGAPVALLASRGVVAQGDLERELVNDFIQKRLSLLGGPDVGLRGGLDIARIQGLNAGQSGEALGDLLGLLQRLRQSGGKFGYPYGTSPGWPVYAGTDPEGLETYRTGKFFVK